MSCIHGLLIGSMLFFVTAANATTVELDKYDDSIENVFAVSTPTGLEDYVAVRYSVPAGIDTPLTISQIRFFNNDANTVWPKIMLTAGDGSGQPGLTTPFATFTNVSGNALDFIAIDTAVTLNRFADFFVVIQFPVGESLTGLGAGPGIGADSDLTLGFVRGNLFSTDGVVFEELQEVNLAIEVTLNGFLRPEEFEPNDVITIATPVEFGEKLKAYIGSENDVDVYSFTGVKGEFVRIDVAAQTLGSPLDATLKLLNSSGDELVRNDDEEFGIILDPLLRTVLPETDIYFLAIEQFSNEDSATLADSPHLFYELSLARIETVPHLTHSTGNVNFTVWSRGIYGDDGTGLGMGFSYMGSPGGTLLTGGFVAATPAKIAANIPNIGLPNHQTLVDFQEDVPFTAFSAQGNFDQIAEATYNEGETNHFSEPIGISVQQTSYSQPNGDFVLVEAVVENFTPTPIADLFIGQFADWDVGVESFENNRGGYDAPRHLVYQFETGASPNDANFYGIKTLQAASGARVTILENFTPDSLFGYLANLNGPGPQPIISDADYRSFIGSGPFTLQPGASVKVGFAWLGGTNLADLQANADAAQAAWDDLIVSTRQDVASVPNEFTLAQNYPNPFNPRTKIKYVLFRNSEVSLAIYNPLGQVVRTLVDERQGVGFYEIQWDGRNDAGFSLSSGVYFYKLKAGPDLQVRKMVLLR